MLRSSGPQMRVCTCVHECQVCSGNVIEAMGWVWQEAGFAGRQLGGSWEAGLQGCSWEGAGEQSDAKGGNQMRMRVQEIGGGFKI